MKARWITAALTAALSVGFLAGTGFSEDPAPSEEQMKQMMDMMMELGKPKAAHEPLKSLAGTWDGTTKVWMGPNTEPMTSKSSAVNTLIMGGRFLQTEYEGSFMDIDFTGFGLMGHDNHKKQYQSLWTDSWSSGMLFETGTGGEDGKTITTSGTHASPMGSFPTRHVWTLIGPDEYKMEGFSDHGGGEVKEMEILFKRRKPAPVLVPCRPRHHVPSKGPGY